MVCPVCGVITEPRTIRSAWSRGMSASIALPTAVQCTWARLPTSVNIRIAWVPGTWAV